MENINTIIMICLGLYLLFDILKNKDMHSNIKMNILAFINLLFICSTIFMLININLNIIDYLFLIIPLRIISAVYQYYRFKASKEAKVNKYTKLFINYIFIIVICIMVKY